MQTGRDRLIYSAAPPGPRAIRDLTGHEKSPCATFCVMREDRKRANNLVG